ncbi:response regulator [candidate division KSB1 bacterium]|nr:response regulator [candidate division KSB1 bacterium]
MAKIMVVENEQHLRRLYTEELEHEGHDVIAVGFGREALYLLDAIPVDLVLLDLKLADGNGLDYLQKMLAHHRDLKIIINTAYPMFKQDFRCWGAERLLIKSSDLSELKQTIGEVLGNSNGVPVVGDIKELNPKISLKKVQREMIDSRIYCRMSRIMETRFLVNI